MIFKNGAKNFFIIETISLKIVRTIFKSLQKIKKINSNEFLQTILFIYFSKIVTALFKIRHRKTDLQNAYIYIYVHVNIRYR